MKGYDELGKRESDLIWDNEETTFKMARLHEAEFPPEFCDRCNMLMSEHDDGECPINVFEEPDEDWIEKQIALSQKLHEERRPQ